MAWHRNGRCFMDGTLLLGPFGLIFSGTARCFSIAKLFELVTQDLWVECQRPYRTLPNQIPFDCLLFALVAKGERTSPKNQITNREAMTSPDSYCDTLSSRNLPLT
jgi:hypothetical protein